MEHFKQRWEITKNWQLIHPFIGILAAALCGYIIAKAILKSFLLPDNSYHLVILNFGSLLLAYILIKISLWLFTKLYDRWKVKARWELIAMFLVFAMTGSTAGKLSNPLMELIGLDRSSTNGWVYWPVRIIIIFPIYQVLLVIFGWIFGQYTFFKAFAIKMATRMGLGFIFKKTNAV
jgi:hypothetical protein